MTKPAKAPKQNVDHAADFIAETHEHAMHEAAKVVAVDEKAKAWRKAEKQKKKTTPEHKAAAKEAKVVAIAAAVATLTKKLTPKAKSINTRLARADDLDGKADDNRISAAIELAEVKTAVDAVEGMSFKVWCEASLEVTHNTVRHLAVCGEAGDDVAPEVRASQVGVALEDFRAKAAARQAKQRDKDRSEAVTARRATDPRSPDTKLPRPPKVSPFNNALQAVQALGDPKIQHQLIEEVVGKDQRVVPKADAKRWLNRDKASAIDSLKEDFSASSATDKLTFLKWAAAECGYTLGAEDFMDMSAKVNIPGITGPAVEAKDLTTPAFLDRAKQAAAGA